jgi:hypothetical protein
MEDFSLLDGYKVPWPSGWAMRSSGAIGLEFIGPTPPLKTRMRWMHVPIPGKDPVVTLRLDEQVIVEWAAKGLGWREESFEVPATAEGKHTLVFEMHARSSDEDLYGLFSIHWMRCSQ